MSVMNPRSVLQCILLSSIKNVFWEKKTFSFLYPLNLTSSAEQYDLCGTGRGRFISVPLPSKLSKLKHTWQAIVSYVYLTLLYMLFELYFIARYNHFSSKRYTHSGTGGHQALLISFQLILSHKLSKLQQAKFVYCVWKYIEVYCVCCLCYIYL